MTLRLGSFLLLIAAGVSADDSPLSLADLEAYRVALSAKVDGSAPLVRFRDLWDRPEAYAGRPVRIEGRVARLFRQPRLGEFPPLVEAWVVSPSGDPFCLVFPQTRGRATPEPGASVRFSGTFLKRIKYQGGDTARVAPLVVGPEPPSTSDSHSRPEGLSWSAIDWMMGLAAAAVVALILARRHLSRPVPPPPVHDPPPVFFDGEPGTDPDEDEEGRAHEDHY